MNTPRRAWPSLVCVLASLLSTTHVVVAEKAPEPIVVFAAASLAETVQEAARHYGEIGNVEVRTSLASSAVLAKQIDAGAAADVFISADLEWMDYLARRGRIVPDTRRNLLSNRLVLVAPAGNVGARQAADTLRLEQGVDLRAALGPDGWLAVGDPDSVPAGRYARAALLSLGAWTSVESRLVRAENVRAALAFVARGEAPLGIAYATDAKAEPRVRVVAIFPAESHPPIVYPAALIRGARPAASGFLEFLSGPTAGALFEEAGFTRAGR